MDVIEYNQKSWDNAVDEGSVWTVPVSPEEIAAAQRGEWEIVLTPEKAVPRAWFPDDLSGVDVLCLAGAGGQQGPILAAAGARVTVFDNSPRQLAQDQLVANREGLEITTVQGDMANLDAFADQSFDLIFHPCSNLFVPDILPVWREAYRVLRPGGVLLSGFTNPAFFLFDSERADRGEYVVEHKLPYSDLTSISDAQRRRYTDKLAALEFGHTLSDQLGGQIDAGFFITGFYEDRWTGQALSEYMDPYIATRAWKPAQIDP